MLIPRRQLAGRRGLIGPANPVRVVVGPYVAERHKSELPRASVGKICIRLKLLDDLDPAVLGTMPLEAAAWSKTGAKSFLAAMPPSPLGDGMGTRVRSRAMCLHVARPAWRGPDAGAGSRRTGGGGLSK